MKETVGVRLPSEMILFPSLKREALMFSRIAITDLRSLLTFAEKSLSKDLNNDLEWLLERELIFDPETEIGSQAIQMKSTRS